MEHLHAIPIRTFMVTEIISLVMNESMADAYEKMKNHRIRHLPIVDRQNKVVGVFTKNDLDRVYSPRETDAGWYYDKDELANLSLSHFMTPNPTVLIPENTLKDAAQIMVRSKYGCIPIVKDMQSKELVGIVTTIDILKVIIQFF